MKSCKKYLKTLDQKIIHIVSANHTEFFKNNLPKEQIPNMYRSSMTKNEQYGTKFKCKIDLQKVRVWDKDKQLIEAPMNWKGQRIILLVTAKSLYFALNMFGTTFECNDVQICENNEEPVKCPFF